MFVAVRVRPLNDKEKNRNDAQAWKILPQFNSIAMKQSEGACVSKRDTFTYDNVFGPESKTEEIYDLMVDPIVDSVVSGIHGTVFAYGQTSCGKTYTMQGHGQVPGILQMAVLGMFEKIEKAVDREFLLRVSYIEIYNEVVRDLLDPSCSVLKIRESRSRGVFVEATEKIVTDFSHITSALNFGDKNRHVEETKMNERSSRSHTIFKITLESKARGNAFEDDNGDDTGRVSTGSVSQDDGAILVADLNLVDLAGSENVRHTGVAGDRLREAGKINTSLLTLSRIIKSLASGEKSHMGFRDSKLTRLLQESLTGKTRTALIACATPSERYVDETKSTLLFAQRAKAVKTCAEVNEILDDTAMLKRLRKDLKKAHVELERLRSEKNASSALKAMKEREEQTLLVNAKLEQRLSEMEKQRAYAEEKVMKLKRKFLSSTRSGVNDAMGPSKKKARRRKTSRKTWCPGTKTGKEMARAVSELRCEMDLAVKKTPELDFDVETLDIWDLENVSENEIRSFVENEANTRSAELSCKDKIIDDLKSKHDDAVKTLKFVQEQHSVALTFEEKYEKSKTELESVSDNVTKLESELKTERERVESLKKSFVKQISDLEKRLIAHQDQDQVCKDALEKVDRLKKEASERETAHCTVESNLKDQIESFRTANEALKTKIDEERKTSMLCVSQLKETSQMLGAEIELTKETCETLRTQRDEVSERLKETEHTLERTNQALSESLSTLSEKEGNLRMTRERLQTMEATQASSSRLAKDFADLQREHETLQSSKKDLSSRCDELSANMTVAMNETERMKKDIANAKSALSEKDAQIEALRSDVHSHEQMSVEYQEKLRLVHETNDSLKATCDELTMTLTTVRGEKSKTDISLQSTQEMLSSLRATYDALLKDLKDEKSRHASSMEQIRRLEENIALAKCDEEKAKNTEDTIRELSSRNDALREENESLRSETAAISANASKVSVENEELVVKLRSAVAKARDHAKDVDRQSTVDQLMATNDELRESLIRSEKHIETLRQQYNESEEKRQKLEHAVQTYQDSSTSSKEAMNKFKSEYERVSGELAELSYDIEEKTCEWKKTIADHKQREMELESKLSSLRDVIKESKKRIAKLESVKLTESQVTRMIEMKKEWKALKKEKRSGVWSTKSSKEFEKMEKEVISLNKKVETMTAQRRKYKETIAKRDSALKQAREMMKEVHAELAESKTVRLELESVQEKLGETEESLRNAKEELEVLHRRSSKSNAAAESNADQLRKHKCVVRRLQEEIRVVKSKLEQSESSKADSEAKLKSCEADIQRAKKQIQVLEKENLELMLKTETTGVERSLTKVGGNISIASDGFSSFAADMDNTEELNVDEGLLLGDTSLLDDVRAAVASEGTDKENCGHRIRRRRRMDAKKRGLTPSTRDSNAFVEKSRANKKARAITRAQKCTHPQIDRVEKSIRPAIMTQPQGDGEGQECTQQ